MRKMHDTARYGEGMPRLQGDRPIVKFNIEVPFHHEKELIRVVMLVPVEVAIHDPKPHPTLVDFAQSTVPPGRLTCAKVGNVELFPLLEQNSVRSMS